MGAQDLEDSHTQTVALQSASMVEASPSMVGEPIAIIRIGCRLIMPSSGKDSTSPWPSRRACR